MPKIVICVDDSKTILASLEIALNDMIQENKIRLITFDNPLEFLELINNNEMEFDMMFSDVNMPEITGFDVIKQVKANPKYLQKPILMLTTENSNEMKSIGKQLGIMGWVTKPFSDLKIQKTVKKVLNV
jgi:two-component system chemotaxis response regulator CheY